MPEEKHQINDLKNRGFEGYLKRSADWGVSLGKKLDKKETAVEAGIDIFQRERKLHEDILRAHKEKKISDYHLKGLITRIMENDVRAGFEMFKKSGLEKEIDLISIIDTEGFIFKHQKLLTEVKKSLIKREKRLIGDNTNYEKENIKDYLSRITHPYSVNEEELFADQNIRRNKINVFNSFYNETAEYQNRIDAHYAEYLRLKKLNALEYKDPRSATEVLAENTLAEFFAPEVEQKKIKYEVGLEINSRNKARAGWLRKFRTLLDKTLNDPEQTWRESQQEFARELALKELPKEIKKSLEKRKSDAKLEFDGDKKEYTVKKDGVELIEKMGEKKLCYEKFDDDIVKIFSIGRGFATQDINLTGFFNGNNATPLGLSDKDLFNMPYEKYPGIRFNEYRLGKGAQRIDGFGGLNYMNEYNFPDLEFNIKNSENSEKRYLELINPINTRVAGIGFFKEDMNKTNILLIGRGYQGDKHLYIENKGVLAENNQPVKILDAWNGLSYIDGAWAKVIQLEDKQWAIYHEKKGLIRIQKNYNPIGGQIYASPEDKIVFSVQDENKKEFIIDEDGNVLSNKDGHFMIDFKGESFGAELIYTVKNQKTDKWPTEIWGTTSDRITESLFGIKKVVVIEGKIYWLNGSNDLFENTQGGDRRIFEYSDTNEPHWEDIDGNKLKNIGDRLVFTRQASKYLGIKATASGGFVVSIVDENGKIKAMDNAHFQNIIKLEDLKGKCLVVDQRKDKFIVYYEGLGEVGGEWDKIYFLKEYENQLLICGRRGEEIVEVAVDLDKKTGLTKEEANKLKLLNLIKKYDWLVYEEKLVRKKMGNTYSISGKEKLSEKEKELKAGREELKKKILEYFENDSAMKEIWQKWNPEKDYRSHSKSFAEKISEMVRTSPEMFLDYFRAKKDRNVEKLAKEMVDYIFKEEEEKIKNEPAKKDHWLKGLASEMVSKLLGEKTVERIGNWWTGKTKNILEKAKLADFFQDNHDIQILGGDPNEKGPGLEVMKFGRDYKGFVCDQILGKCDDGKNWNKIDFPATVNLTEPTKEITTTIEVDKKWDKIILPKPVQAKIISSRIKGITSKGKEISLEKREIENDFGQGTVFLNPNDDIVQLKYSWQENQFETGISEIDDYDIFRKKFIRENEMSDLAVDIAPNMDEKYSEILEKIKKLSPKGKVEAIQEFVKKIGYYDMDNVETLKDKENKTLDERLLLMESRMDWLKEKNPKLAGKMEKKFVAGVCADYALLMIALLRKAGFMAGYAGGYDVKGRAANTKEAHAMAFVVWPDEKGEANIFTVDGTPGGVDEEQQRKINQNLKIETIEEKEKNIRKEKESEIATVGDRIQDLAKMDEANIAEIDNGELEKIMNNYLSLITKKSHLKIVGRILDAFWYTDADKKDISNSEIKREIQFLLLEEFGKEYNSLTEADKNIASGGEMFELVETFVDKFKKADPNLTTAAALEKLKIIIDTVPKGLLSRPERVVMTIIIKYLEAKKMASEIT